MPKSLAICLAEPPLLINSLNTFLACLDEMVPSSIIVIKPLKFSGVTPVSASSTLFLFKCSLTLPINQLDASFGRSEEHTSELQSRFDLVCRLLLEKKKRCRGQLSRAATALRPREAGQHMSSRPGRS